jgi:hypothetical protein
MENTSGKIILLSSIPLSILITLVSCVGILTPDFYTKETFNWRILARFDDEAEGT